MKFSKNISIILILFISHFIIAQNSEQKADAMFLKEYPKQVDKNYFNIFLSSNDCYRCLGGIHQTLSEIEQKTPLLQINVITDQIPFARKEIKDYKLKINFLAKKEIFEKDPKSFYYLKNNGQIFTDTQEIISQLSNFTNDSNTILNNITAFENTIINSLSIEDSLFTSSHLFHSGIFDDNLIVYDNSIDLGGIINAKNKIQYYDITTSSAKIYNLPYILDLNEFQVQPIEYQDYQNLAKESIIFKNPEIKVNSISVHKDLAYTHFAVSRLFQNTTKENAFNLFTFNYVAVKKINKDNISTIFDLETYDSYFDVDNLDYDGKTYRFGIAIYYPFSKIIDKFHFVSKIDHEADFIGEATLELSEDLKKLSILSINTKANKDFIFPSLQIGNTLYYVSKDMTDESSGKGIISLKKSKAKLLVD